MNNLDKHRVAKNFSDAAAGYEQHAVLQKLVAERLLSRLDLIKLAPKWIIDAGSGAGFSARALKKKYRAARVMQIDLSHAMLFYSRKKSSRWFPGQYFVCADTEQLPVPTTKIDLVFSSLMLQWCSDLDRAVTEAVRVLRPMGLYLFATLGPGTLRELRASWAGVDDGRHVHTFIDMHDVGDALVRAGMEGVVMESEKITLTYKDCTGLMRDLKTLGANNAVVSRHKGLTGRHKMQRMAQNYEKYRIDGSLPATYEVIYGHAWAPAQRAQSTRSGQTVFVPVASLKRNKNAG
jgi:malonyl-CoA O-methyltransferase